MFRHSDIPPTRLHQTYSNKSVPMFQKQQQIAKFDECSSAHDSINPYTGQSISVSISEHVSGAVDTLYDPDHPDADWSGFVSKNPQKRHMQGHASQHIGIQHCENGLVSTEDRDEFGRKRRIDSKVSSSHKHLIGGIAPEEPWKSNYQRFANQESTLTDQYSQEKQHLPRRISGSIDEVPSPSMHFKDHISTQGSVNMKSSTRQPKASYGSHSRTLLQDISTSILDQIPEYDANTSYSKQRAEPTLVTTNYKAQVPGYTGRRTVR